MASSVHPSKPSRRNDSEFNGLLPKIRKHGHYGIFAIWSSNFNVNLQNATDALKFLEKLPISKLKRRCKIFLENGPAIRVALKALPGDHGEGTRL